MTTTTVAAQNSHGSAQPGTTTATDGETAYLAGLRKTFTAKGRQVHAVDGIDLTIAKGEYVVVLGPSGCGKSTLLRCIAGLEEPTEGKVGLPGRVVYDQAAGINVPSSKRNVGMVFQNYALWPHMTVEKNVAYPLRMRKVSRHERADRTAAILQSLECEPLRTRLPAELSGGQQQRVALARALVSEPGLLLLDEPLSNLDALLRVSLRAELLRLHRKLGFTALHITHDQEEALEMGDRVVLMREGRIEQIGPPEEVYARPVSPYAANFLGVRNRLAVTATPTGLHHAEGKVAGTEGLVGKRVDGEAMELFVRSREVHITEQNTARPDPVAGAVRLDGKLAQVVLGEGGRRQYIVDVAGKQWFAQHADSDNLSIGDNVSVFASRGSLLLYHGDTRVETEVAAS